MLVTVRVLLDDGRVIELARDVRDEEDLSPAGLLEREAVDGTLSLSDSERVPLERIARAEFVEKDAPTGPGWGPGLQDEDAASAAAGNYDGPERT
jgi:hypothetical protein